MMWIPHDAWHQAIMPHDVNLMMHDVKPPWCMTWSPHGAWHEGIMMGDMKPSWCVTWSPQWCMTWSNHVKPSWCMLWRLPDCVHDGDSLDQTRCSFHPPATKGNKLEFLNYKKTIVLDVGHKLLLKRFLCYHFGVVVLEFSLVIHKTRWKFHRLKKITVFNLLRCSSTIYESRQRNWHSILDWIYIYVAILDLVRLFLYKTSQRKVHYLNGHINRIRIKSCSRPLCQIRLMFSLKHSFVVSKKGLGFYGAQKCALGLESLILNLENVHQNLTL